MNLFEELKTLGFKNVILPITKKEKFINFFYPKNNPKYTPKVQDYWLEKSINGKSCQVFELDIWYVRLTYDGIALFDERRFKNEELIKLIPNEK